jgi:RHS repeat-associated protein
MESVTPGTITLAGPGGVVAAKVIAAEGGRLAFVTPLDSLAPRTSYVLTVNGVRDVTNQAFPVLTVSFTTSDLSNDLSTDDEWDPASTGRWQDWRTGRPRSPWQDLPPLQAPAGVTAVSGQVLRLNGSPLANVTLELNGRRSRTDGTGRFLLETPQAPAGWHELWIDGRLGQGNGAGYGTYEAAVHLRSGRTNVLPFTIWLTKIDTAHRVAIPTPTTAETVVTTPKIPGLELRLPPGAVVKDHDGRVVSEISITPIPLDRTPFPLPVGVDVPIYFTIQPGGAYVEVPGGGSYRRGARLIYPNYRGRRAKTPMEFWHYEPDDGRGWYVYGKGAVAADGRQVVPDHGVSIYEFTGAMVADVELAAAIWAELVAFFGGDPVDLGTGLFILDDIDLMLPDTLPISINRTYRQNDSIWRAFGIGASHNYDIFLVTEGFGYATVYLVLPNGTRVRYNRTSPGSLWYDVIAEHTSSSGVFANSRLEWFGGPQTGGWLVTLKDGTWMTFKDSLFAERPMQAAVTHIQDRYGNALILTRNSAMDLTRVTSPNGRWIELTHDTSHRITEARDNLNRAVQYTYDASGRLWKVTDVRGGITEYTYDAAHRMLTIKDPRGIVYLTNEYDGNGRVIEQTQADSSTFQFNYTLDGAGKVTQTDMTDPRGFVRRVSYNADGMPTADTYALGQPQQQTYTYEWQAGTSLLLAIVDPLSRRTAYAYDAANNLTSVTRLAGTANAVTDSFTYEPTFQQLASVTDALSQQTLFEYDAKGSLAKIRDPLSHDTLFTYNGAGQLLAVTDALNQRTDFTYAGGDLVQQTDPLGRATRAFVDSGGRLITATDAVGRVTRYERNAKNQVTKVTDALGHETTFTYDPNGRLLTLTDANNHTTTYTYNNMDRVVTRTDPLSREDTYVYDANGNLTQTTDRKNQVRTTTYDPLNRPVTTTFADTATVTNTYDAGHRLTEVVDSVGGTVARAYDLLDRLTSETTPEGSVSYTYDALNRRATMTVAGQSAVSYSYDNASRLTGVTQGSASVTLAYDAADRRTSLTLPNGIVVSYGYDAASQLTGLTYALGETTLGALTYGHDALGRRTTVGGSWARTGLPAALTAATYDAANQVSTWGGITLTHDANGNLTSDGTRTYTWDARDQLSALGGAVGASFSYDAFGRRRAKTVSGITTGFLYDGLNTAQELTGGTPSANLLTGGIDETFARTDGSGTRHLLADGLGSTLGIADASGVVQTQYTYQPFGATTTSGAADANSAQFTGREQDGTGLYFYRGRYQHPTLQRFVSEDPIGFLAGDPNLYSYVFNSPTNLTDPTGEFAGAMLGGCAFGAASSAAADLISGRKLNWGAAATGCASGMAMSGIFGAFARGGVAIRGLGLGGGAPGAGTGAAGRASAAGGTRGTPSLIYRGGSNSARNLTPRPGDTTGLSTFDNAEAAFGNSNKAQVIDTTRLRNLCATCDAHPPGHVTVAPRTAAELAEWSSTRGTETVHPLTKELMDAIVGEVRR